mgnify:CR=1 FL=1
MVQEYSTYWVDEPAITLSFSPTVAPPVTNSPLPQTTFVSTTPAGASLTPTTQPTQVTTNSDRNNLPPVSQTNVHIPANSVADVLENVSKYPALLDTKSDIANDSLHSISPTPSNVSSTGDGSFSDTLGLLSNVPVVSKSNIPSGDISDVNNAQTYNHNIVNNTNDQMLGKNTQPSVLDIPLQTHFDGFGQGAISPTEGFDSVLNPQHDILGQQPGDTFGSQNLPLDHFAGLSGIMLEPPANQPGQQPVNTGSQLVGQYPPTANEGFGHYQADTPLDGFGVHQSTSLTDGFGQPPATSNVKGTDQPPNTGTVGLTHDPFSNIHGLGQLSGTNLEGLGHSPSTNADGLRQLSTSSHVDGFGPLLDSPADGFGHLTEASVQNAGQAPASSTDGFETIPVKNVHGSNQTPGTPFDIFGQTHVASHDLLQLNTGLEQLTTALTSADTAKKLNPPTDQSIIETTTQKAVIEQTSKTDVNKTEHSGSLFVDVAVNNSTSPQLNASDLLALTSQGVVDNQRSPSDGFETQIDHNRTNTDGKPANVPVDGFGHSFSNLPDTFGQNFPLDHFESVPQIPLEHTENSLSTQPEALLKPLTAPSGSLTKDPNEGFGGPPFDTKEGYGPAGLGIHESLGKGSTPPKQVLGQDTTGAIGDFSKLSNANEGFSQHGLGPNEGFAQSPLSVPAELGKQSLNPPEGLSQPPIGSNEGFGHSILGINEGFGQPPLGGNEGFGQTAIGPNEGFEQHGLMPNEGFGQNPGGITEGFGQHPLRPNEGFGQPPTALNDGFGQPPTALNDGFGQPPTALNDGFGQPPTALNDGFGQQTSSNEGFGQHSLIQNEGFGQLPLSSNEGLSKPSRTKAGFDTNLAGAIEGFGRHILEPNKALEKQPVRATAGQLGTNEGFGQKVSSPHGGFGPLPEGTNKGFEQTATVPTQGFEHSLGPNEGFGQHSLGPNDGFGQPPLGQHERPGQPLFDPTQGFGTSPNEDFGQHSTGKKELPLQHPGPNSESRHILSSSNNFVTHPITPGLEPHPSDLSSRLVDHPSPIDRFGAHTGIPNDAFGHQSLIPADGFGQHPGAQTEGFGPHTISPEHPFNQHPIMSGSGFDQHANVPVDGFGHFGAELGNFGQHSYAPLDGIDQTTEATSTTAVAYGIEQSTTAKPDLTIPPNIIHNMTINKISSFTPFLPTALLRSRTNKAFLSNTNSTYPVVKERPNTTIKAHDSSTMIPIHTLLQRMNNARPSDGFVGPQIQPHSIQSSGTDTDLLQPPMGLGRGNMLMHKFLQGLSRNPNLLNGTRANIVHLKPDLLAPHRTLDSSGEKQTTVVPLNDILTNITDALSTLMTLKDSVFNKTVQPESFVGMHTNDIVPLPMPVPDNSVYDKDIYLPTSVPEMVTHIVSTAKPDSSSLIHKWRQEIMGMIKAMSNETTSTTTPTEVVPITESIRRKHVEDPHKQHKPNGGQLSEDRSQRKMNIKSEPGQSSQVQVI